MGPRPGTSSSSASKVSALNDIINSVHGEGGRPGKVTKGRGKDAGSKAKAKPTKKNDVKQKDSGSEKAASRGENASGGGGGAKGESNSSGGKRLSNQSPPGDSSKKRRSSGRGSEGCRDIRTFFSFTPKKTDNVPEAQAKAPEQEEPEVVAIEPEEPQPCCSKSLLPENKTTKQTAESPKTHQMVKKKKDSFRNELAATPARKQLALVEPEEQNTAPPLDQDEAKDSGKTTDTTKDSGIIVSDSDRESDSDSDSDSEPPEGEYEVETIANFKNIEGEEFFNVKWKGYDDPSDNTWEPKTNLDNCDKAMISFFWKRVGELKEDTFPELIYKRAKFRLPEDPRPLLEQGHYFLNVVNRPLTEMEINDNYKLYRLGKLEKWNVSLLKTCFRKVVLGLSLEPPKVETTAKQVAIIEGESRIPALQKALKDWEKALNEITNGRPKITVENSVDLVGPPAGFTYVNGYVAGEGVIIPNDPLTGCACNPVCSTSQKGAERQKCYEAHFNCWPAYNMNKKVRIPKRLPIYECNQHCACGPECFNRVVQDGSVSLQGAEYCIFRARNDCGWGVKTLKPIPRGTFVSLYTGEVITSEEAELRGTMYDGEGLTYLFDLDFNSQTEEGVAAGEDSDNLYTVDAKNYGNISHFINHSCEPNLEVYNVFVECVDPDLPMLALFACRNIAADEELSFDYKSDADGKGIKDKLKLMTCQCGTASCRKKVF